MSIASQAASLTYEKISYTYPGVKHAAINDIQIDVNPGELVVFVGPSGCGKSTLLRIAAGLVFPEFGRLLIDGIDTLKLPTEKRRIGWVPQSYALFEHLNIADNVAFGLKMNKIPKVQRNKQVKDMLKLCRIEDLAERSVRALSGGQRQRVAIARALAVNPRVLLLDEPLAALDPQLRIAIRADLELLLRESGVTTLFVTHDQSEALAIADRVVVLRDGRIEQTGSPEELWNSPVNDFVAEFFSNAIIVKADPVDAMTAEIIPGLRCSLNRKIDPVKSIRLALRKDDFTLSDDGVKGKIKYSEYNGGLYLMKVETKNKILIPVSSGQELSIGSEVLVNVKKNACITVVGK
ncbi:MAG TPA: spermidine/putrescine ABC transporter ATP-binding protein [Actinobacteria bacterium]|nr:spermidine/putrescine ABC transporter ATP-binding protein [Actinomycetota bacterium]